MSTIRMMPRSNSKRAAFAYELTAFAALGAALYMALNIDLRLSNGAAVSVNGTPISQSDYARAVKAMQAGLERPLTEDDKKRALERLIDEELIVQEAIKLGLPSTDRLVRRNLVQGMMRSVTSLEATRDISEDDIRAFYNDNRNLFAVPRLVSLQVARSSDADKTSQFIQAVKSGLSFPEAAKNSGLALEVLPLSLPLGKVGGLIGGPSVDMVSKMEAGDIAGPAPSGEGQIFIWMTNSSGGEAAYTDIRETVKTELQRRRDEAALDDYLARLRARSRIKRSPQK